MVKHVVVRMVAGTLLVTMVAGCTERAATQQPAPSVSSTPRANAQGVAADASYAQDERDLVQSATLILVGTPTDEKQEISRSSDGGIVN